MSRWSSSRAPDRWSATAASTRRPADAAFMHYECELAVVIGRTRAAA